MRRRPAPISQPLRRWESQPRTRPPAGATTRPANSFLLSTDASVAWSDPDARSRAVPAPTSPAAKSLDRWAGGTAAPTAFLATICVPDQVAMSRGPAAPGRSDQPCGKEVRQDRCEGKSNREENPPPAGERCAKSGHLNEYVSDVDGRVGQVPQDGEHEQIEGVVERQQVPPRDQVTPVHNQRIR